MKIKKFDEIFCDEGLQAVLWPNKANESEIEKDELIENLFKVNSEEKERFVKLFEDALLDNLNAYPKDCKKLDKKFKKVLATQQQMVPHGRYGCFDDEWRTLPECAARANVLRVELQDQGNMSTATKLIKKMKSHTKSDPAIGGHTETSLDRTRSGRNREGCTLNANDVQLGSKRNYLLSACPKNVQEAKDLYHIALQQNISLFVSLLGSKEAEKYCNNFWTKEKLTQIILDDEWTVTHLATKVLYKSKEQTSGEEAAQIIETSLICHQEGQKSQKITHLHIDGWLDHKACPDEELFQIFLDQIEKRQEATDAPFEINCKHGQGRTGTLAVCHYIRQKIDESLAQGISLGDIHINIPEIIYAFRKQRKSCVSQGIQLAQVYSITGAYYEHLKKQQQLVAQIAQFDGLKTAEGQQLVDLIFAYGRGQLSDL